MKPSPHMEIPPYLKQYVVDQQYNKYNWRDQAVWRYVMRRNLSFLSKAAHVSYLDGLKQTGISIEEIPSLDEMNKILSAIGWSAVCVNGFIPPEAFMEFQAHKILVIAADIRHLKHIEYTPAPDILHEAAGHAPIIANTEYSKYLQEFGKVGARAFSSGKDHELYEAIKKLSDLKAIPDTSAEKIQTLENQIALLEKNVGNPSEMSLLRNLHWWTVEYGLVGSPEDPKIYGAGLLSSIGESAAALKPEVKKIPYTLEAMHYGFDITRMQPQLFVTPDFKNLTNVLHQFAEQMAQVKGGAEAALKAIESKRTATAVLSSGIQITGVFSELILQGAELVYLKTSGPTELKYKNQLLSGHDSAYHSEGYGTPIGRLRNCNKPVRYLENSDLKKLNLLPGKKTSLEFLSGLKLEGVLRNIVRKDGCILLMSFINCRVEYGNKVLFEPEWGVFDMAVGEQLISAYSDKFSPGNAAERSKLSVYQRTGNTIPEKLDRLYLQVRTWRKNKSRLENVSSMLDKLASIDPEDWLLPFEMREIAKETNDKENARKIQNYLDNFKDEIQHLINV